MRGVNQVMLIGRLGADPELRKGASGKPYGWMSVATNRARRDGDEWVEETDWHSVRVFGDEAVRCHQMLRKGSLVAVEGTLTYQKWTDDNGSRHVSARVLTSRITFLEGAGATRPPRVDDFAPRPLAAQA